MANLIFTRGFLHHPLDLQHQYLIDYFCRYYPIFLLNVYFVVASEFSFFCFVLYISLCTNGCSIVYLYIYIYTSELK